MKKLFIYFGILIFAFCFSAWRIEALDEKAETDLQDLLNVSISTASKYEQTASEAPASVSIITNDEIKRYGYRTLAEILRNEIGFFISDDKNYTFVGARGFLLPGSFNNKILLLLDNHTLNDNVYGSTYYDTEYALDLNNVERIEIVRGPGSALYGTNALFAVINIITKNAKQLNGIHINGNVGSFGNLSLAIGAGYELAKDISFAISSKYGQFAGQDYYFKEFDTIPFDGFAKARDKSNYFGSNINADIYQFHINGFFSTHLQHTPTAKFETYFNSNNFEETDTRAFVEIKRKINFEEIFSLDMRFYYDYYTYKGAFPKFIDSIEHEENLGNSFGSEVQGIIDIASNLRATLGFQYENNFLVDYDKYSEEKAVKLTDPYNLFSIYFNANWQPTKEISLVIGAREDYYNKSLNSLNPRVGIIYNPCEGTTFKFLIGKAFRRPTIYETKYYDLGIQKPSINLMPEKILTYEAIIEQSISKSMFLSVSGFYYEIEELIDLIEDSDSLQIFQNLSPINAKGIEAKIIYKITNLTSLSLGVTYTDCNVPDSNSFISYPSKKMTINLNQEINENLFVGANILYEDGRITTLWQKTPDYLLADLYAMYLIRFSQSYFPKSLRLNLNLNNIFDTKYSHSVSRENKMDRIVQAGFNFSISLSIDI